VLDVSRRRTGWLLGGVVAAIAATGLFAAQRGDAGEDRVEAAVAAVVAAPDDDDAFRRAIEAVAADGPDTRSALQLAAVLPPHLDALQGLDRPLVVDALTALVATDARPAVLAALADWVVAVVDPAVAGDATYDEAAARLREQVAPVVVAAVADLPRHEQAMRELTGPARDELARRIAEREGIADLPPDLRDDLLAGSTAQGDPVVVLEQAVDEQRADGAAVVWGPGDAG
jgi:hypothetical protein